MRCHRHPEVEAIGVCLACLRGVCAECGAEVGRALACRARCEVDVRRLLDLREFNLKQPVIQATVIQRTRRIQTLAGIFLIFSGIGVIVLGLVAPSYAPLIILGAILAPYGVLTLRAALRTVPNEHFRLCGGCGYNLTGNRTGVCPECGQRA
jgi:hypothetical protein